MGPHRLIHTRRGQQVEPVFDPASGRFIEVPVERPVPHPPAATAAQTNPAPAPRSQARDP